MSGKTSTASKRLYNEKAYDRISLVVKKDIGRVSSSKGGVDFCQKSIRQLV